MRYFCSKDCYDFCEFNLDTDSSGKVVFEPIAKPWEKTGFVCSKLKGFYQRETEQAATPFVVENGAKRNCSDAEALDYAAALLRKHADGRILALRGSGSLGLMMKYWETLLTQLPGMEIIESGLCDTTGDQAHLDDFGVLKNPPLKNLDHVNTILLFGKNARVTSPHLYAHLIQLKKLGKKIIYIDPVRSETASLADHYIHINPGSDGCLANLLLDRLGKEEQNRKTELQETCAISDADLDVLQHSIIEGKTAFICGYGMQRYRNGKNSFQWVNRLAVATGNINYIYMGHSSTKDLVKPLKKECPELSLAQAVKAMEQGTVDLLV
ncbi:MAG: molybdopterin-dependent oxidoreductase, partial [Thermodesulfobacteriota bacterium]|nr:molybdopterin-dependent oxidoreductase [Thermodesulfobacteriota bacterium]